MIQIQRGEVNNLVATCSRNKTLTGNNVNYLWSMTHKLTNQNWRFLPYRIPPLVNYAPSYDLFVLNVDYSLPEVFTGATSSNDANAHLLDGQYYVKIYEQYSSTNLNPQLSHDVVYEGTADVNFSGSPQNEIITYSGTGQVFKIYNG